MWQSSRAKIYRGLARESVRRVWTDVTSLPLARLYGAHEIEETEEGPRLSSRLEVRGPLACLWCRLVIEGIAAGIPRQMDALARRAAAA